MTGFKILFINLGYARGIDGRLSQHLLYAHRHIRCSPAVQRKTIQQLGRLIESENPDLCCIVEIDRGGAGHKAINQLMALQNETYAFGDIENKYAEKSLLRSFPVTAGKSNGFVSKVSYRFNKLYFSQGVKRLIYKIYIDDKLTLFFAHFSLQQRTRSLQILEMRNLLAETKGDVILLGDFNILSGLREITPFLQDGRFQLLNRADQPTFSFLKKRHILDLCICSTGIGENAILKVVPQPYTDHAALILEINIKNASGTRHID